MCDITECRCTQSAFFSVRTNATKHERFYVCCFVRVPTWQGLCQLLTAAFSKCNQAVYTSDDKDTLGELLRRVMVSYDASGSKNLARHLATVLGGMNLA